MIKKIFLTSSIIATSLMAENFSTTNLQFLYGSKFDGDTFVHDTDNGKKSTITAEHYSMWKYGDAYIFVDFAKADNKFKYQDKEYDTYGEIQPRFSLSKISGNDLSFGIIKDVYISTQYNQGEGYRATLVGGGVDLKVPFFSVFGVNLYNKKTNLNDDTYQLSLNYTMPFTMIGLHFTIDGFIDLTGDDFLTQNQFLVDLGKVSEVSSVKAGVEWHYYKEDKTNTKDNVPQAMVKWSW